MYPVRRPHKLLGTILTEVFELLGLDGQLDGKRDLENKSSN